MRGQLWCSVAALIVAAVDARAEPAQPPTVTNGDHVCVTAPSVSKNCIEGTLAGAELETLTVLPLDEDGAKVTVPRSRITKLEVVRGRKSYALLGGLIGAANGAAIGVFLSNPPSSATRFDVDGTAMVGSMAVGTAIGALVGALVHRDRWTTVPADAVTVHLGPASRGGVEMRVRLSF